MNNPFKESEPKCPHCDKLLCEVGFKTFEPTTIVYDWRAENVAHGKEAVRALLGKEYREDVVFIAHQRETTPEDGREIDAKCASCNGELDWDLLIDAGLV